MKLEDYHKISSHKKFSWKKLGVDVIYTLSLFEPFSLFMRDDTENAFVYTLYNEK